MITSLNPQKGITYCPMLSIYICTYIHSALVSRNTSHCLRWARIRFSPLRCSSRCWPVRWLKYCLLFFVFSLSSLALCENHPKIIEEISGTIERNLGENATLDCKVNNPENFVVSWVKLNRDNPSDQTVLSYDENLVVKNRLKMSVTPSRDKFSLEVNFNLFGFWFHSHSFLNEIWRRNK